MNRYLTEFIGTFFLVLTIGFAVLAAAPLAPVAIGSALMVMIFMGGHISGAHYNPAVSLAVLIRGKVSPADFAIYVVSQILGAAAAAFVVYLVLDKTCPIAPGEGVLPWKAVLVEVLYTFALALVVLNVATAKGTEGNSFYGLAIGFTVLTGAVAVGGISGGAFNPAVGTGLTVVHALQGGGNYSHLWIYLVGPFIGGALAGVVFKIQHPGEA
ncbi:MAG: aquaporin [Planctomycetaceae bacterium]|nr:aquaporin [Planctomycetaceae bacterium]